MTRVAEFEKNSREVVRVNRGDFKGHDMLNIRVWCRSDDDDLRPGRQGIAIKADKVPDLVKAISEVSQ